MAALPDLHVSDSSEAMLSGRKPPFRLLVRAAHRDGRKVNIRHAVSEGFVVRLYAWLPSQMLCLCKLVGTAFQILGHASFMCAPCQHRTLFGAYQSAQPAGLLYVGGMRGANPVCLIARQLRAEYCPHLEVAMRQHVVAHVAREVMHDVTHACLMFVMLLALHQNTVNVVSYLISTVGRIAIYTIG